MKDKKKPFKVQVWEELDSRGWITPLSEPSDAFCEWWKNHDHAPRRITGARGNKGWTSGITARKAWMCADYRDEFRVRGNDYAGGTGVNYAYFGWFRPFPRERMGNPNILEKHRAWCKAHNKPDPLKEEPQEVPEHIRGAKSFEDIKKALAFLVEKMDMNKAIGWTKEDSKVANEQPF